MTADANAYHDAAAHIRTLCRAATPRWRAAIAWGALRELDPDDAAEVADCSCPMTALDR